ncbi:DNA ligase 1-like [Adelges cooleyi]|uniref:DNA ligase 1-like n=1 Tax=Adelges cooleyi TaxID=133065 RepID=UPI00217F37A8|nr:DNA ligase 1-like [Adelges cooleyi]
MVEIIKNRGLLTTQRIQRSYCSSKRPQSLFKPRNPSLFNVKSKPAASSPFKSRGVPKFGFSPVCSVDKVKLSCEKKTTSSPKSCSEAKPKPPCDKEPPPAENTSCEKKEPPVTKKPCGPATEQTKALSSSAKNSSCEKKEPPTTKKPCSPTTEQTKASSPISSEQKQQSQTKTTGLPKTKPQATISSAFKSHNGTEISTSSDSKKTSILSIPFLKRLQRSEPKKTPLATAAHTKQRITATPPKLKKPNTSIKRTPSNIINDFKRDPPIQKGFVIIPKKNSQPYSPQIPKSTTSTSKNPPKRSKIDSSVYVNKYIQHSIKSNAIQPSKAVTKVKRVDPLIRQGLIERSKDGSPMKKISYTDRKVHDIVQIESDNKRNSKKKAVANLKVNNDKKAGCGKEDDTGKKADVNNKVNDSPDNVIGKVLKKKNYLIRPHFNDKNVQHPPTADSPDPRKPRTPPTRPKPPKKTFKSQNVYSKDEAQNLIKKIYNEKIREELADQFHSDDTFLKDQNSTKSQHQNSEFLWLRPSQDQPKKTFISHHAIFEEAIKNEQMNNSVGENLTLDESLQRLKRRNDILQIIADNLPQIINKISSDEIKIRLHIIQEDESPPSTSTSTSSHNSRGSLTSKLDPKSPSGSRGKHTYTKLISDINNQTKSTQITPNRENEVQAETKVKPLEQLQAAIAYSLQMIKVALFNKDH